MAIAGGNISLDSTEGMDRITQTDKVTSPYFSDGATTLLAANVVSSSLTDTKEHQLLKNLMLHLVVRMDMVH